jgi:hypothetical protein
VSEKKQFIKISSCDFDASDMPSNWLPVPFIYDRQTHRAINFLRAKKGNEHSSSNFLFLLTALT